MALLLSLSHLTSVCTYTRFIAVCHMDMKSGFLTLENFKAALTGVQRQPKLECLKGTSFEKEKSVFLLFGCREILITDQNTFAMSFHE